MCHVIDMATRKYSTLDGNLVTREHRSALEAVEAAATLPGLVRVATPTGSLIRYVDNRSGK